jgi:hypothetical protein
MVFRAHIQNGRVVADNRIELPNGTPVRVVPEAKPSRVARVRRAAAKPRRGAATFAESFAVLVGACRGLPADAASRLDDYLYQDSR